MTDYTLGFLLSRTGRTVLLIHKARGPAHVRGRLNGLGGKVEVGETPAEGMHREAKEEAGVTLPWVSYGTMLAPGACVHLFHATVNDRDRGAYGRTLDATEPVAWYVTQTVVAGRSEPPPVTSVPPLIALAEEARRQGRGYEVCIRSP